MLEHPVKKSATPMNAITKATDLKRGVHMIDLGDMKDLAEITLSRSGLGDESPVTGRTRL
jgi:hypothetical protein